MLTPSFADSDTIAAKWDTSLYNLEHSSQTTYNVAQPMYAITVDHLADSLGINSIYNGVRCEVPSSVADNDHVVYQNSISAMQMNQSRQTVSVIAGHDDIYFLKSTHNSYFSVPRRNRSEDADHGNHYVKVLDPVYGAANVHTHRRFSHATNVKVFRTQQNAITSSSSLATTSFSLADETDGEDYTNVFGVRSVMGHAQSSHTGNVVETSST